MKSIVHLIKSLIPGPQSGPLAASLAASKTLVIDPGGGNKGREKLPPGAQVKILQRISRLVDREKLSVSVVYEGKDLRAVSHGDEFQGVRVFFSQAANDLAGAVKEALRKAPRSTPVTVVSDDPEVEKVGVSAGAEVMRLTTLEKAVDGGIRRGGGGGGGGRSGRGGQRPRRRRSSEQQPRMSRQGGSDKDPVRDLLDLVE